MTDHMEPFARILVDVDATTAAHPALDRAVALARRCGAAVTLADVLTVPPETRRFLPSGLEEEMVSHRRQLLERLTRTISGIDVRSILLTGRPATAITQQVLRGGHDLLLRSHARDMAASATPFGAVDMELLRKCPCPVLLVRARPRGERPPIVGAVNAGSDDPAEHALNAKIVETTLLLARLEGGLPMLLHAWAPFAERMIRSHSSDDVFETYVNNMRRRSTEDLARLTRSFGDRLAGVQAVSRRGAAEDVIPEFVAAEGADVVVMGTMARSGISGMLIGNTAERILRRLPCSVLAVKPDGFVSPVVVS